MDATDGPVVRVVVGTLAALGTIGWLIIRRDALWIRPGRGGILLRGRTIIFLTYALDSAVMSAAIMLGLKSGAVLVVWRSVTRVLAQLLVVTVAAEILYNEWWPHRHDRIGWCK